jgi:hypothetical protein
LVPAAAAALITTSAAAEVVMPPRCPRAKLSQQVGLTDLTVEYNSPAVRGRALWGATVPYGEPWRAGDNPAAKITFSREVVFAGQKVPAGTYALLPIPASGDWTLALNRNASLFETNRDYKPDLDVARVKVRAKAAPHRERLTFLFSDFTDEQAMLDLEWERVRVSIPIKVDTREQVLAGIKALDDVWRGYATVARYMLETKKDYDAGLKYIDRSLALQESAQALWIKASLLAAKGLYGEARAEGEKAAKLGGKPGDDPSLDVDAPSMLAAWSRAADRPVPAVASKRTAKAETKVAMRKGRAAARASALDPPPVAAGPLGELPDDPPAPAAHPPLPATEPPPQVAKPVAADNGTGEAAPPLAPPAPTGLDSPPLAKVDHSNDKIGKLDERPAPVRAVVKSAPPTGTPRPAEIAPIIERGKVDIQTCYQRALRQDPTLTHGKVTVSISIGVSGLVKGVVLDSPRKLRTLEPCIKEAVSHWVFPPSTVEYGAELPIALQGKE